MTLVIVAIILVLFALWVVIPRGSDCDCDSCSAWRELERKGRRQGPKY